ncbi:MAG: hypothetical protein IJO68_09055 [Clostridia bacterium]|nr:hypothetical protein [Clostridia bacterium]
MKKITDQTARAVFIPKTNKNDDALFVAVNGKRILVRKGENVNLPLQFAEVVENSLKAQRDAELFIDMKSSEV